MYGFSKSVSVIKMIHADLVLVWCRSIFANFQWQVVWNDTSFQICFERWHCYEAADGLRLDYALPVWKPSRTCPFSKFSISIWCQTGFSIWFYPLSFPFGFPCIKDPLRRHDENCIQIKPRCLFEVITAVATFQVGVGKPGSGLRHKKLL